MFVLKTPSDRLTIINLDGEDAMSHRDEWMRLHDPEATAFASTPGLLFIGTFNWDLRARYIHT